MLLITIVVWLVGITNGQDPSDTDPDGVDSNGVDPNEVSKGIRKATDEVWLRDMTKHINNIAQNYIQEVNDTISAVAEVELKNVRNSTMLSKKLDLLTDTTLNGIDEINEIIDGVRSMLKERYDFVKHHFNIIRFMGSNGRKPNKFDYISNYVWAL